MVVVTNGGSELQATPNPGDNPDGKDDDYERNSPAADRETPLRRSAFRAMVQDFGPLWFTWLVFITPSLNRAKLPRYIQVYWMKS